MFVPALVLGNDDPNDLEFKEKIFKLETETIETDKFLRKKDLFKFYYYFS